MSVTDKHKAHQHTTQHDKETAKIHARLLEQQLTIMVKSSVIRQEQIQTDLQALYRMVRLLSMVKIM